MFRTIGWTYGEQEPPTHQKLAEVIAYLIEHCQEDNFLSTGRFIVRRETMDGVPEISVSLDLYEGPEPEVG